eukprot:COSAG04_NODE_147_length_22902_cov_55.666184_8_plen_89_part_00
MRTPKEADCDDAQERLTIDANGVTSGALNIQWAAAVHITLCNIVGFSKTGIYAVCRMKGYRLDRGLLKTKGSSEHLVDRAPRAAASLT